MHDWALALNLAPGPRPSRNASCDTAYLLAAREARIADLELQLDTSELSGSACASGFIPTHLKHLSVPEQSEILSDMRGLSPAEQAVILNALASVSADDMSIEELRAELDGTEAAMSLLRAAAPLYGRALRPDFLYHSGIKRVYSKYIIYV